jgi:hypothetical protein
MAPELNRLKRKTIMRRRSKVYSYLFAALLGFVVVPSSEAAASNSLFAPDVAKRLDAEIEGILKKNNLPSVAVGISVPGKGQYELGRRIGGSEVRCSTHVGAAVSNCQHYQAFRSDGRSGAQRQRAVTQDGRDCEVVSAVSECGPHHGR